MRERVERALAQASADEEPAPEGTLLASVAALITPSGRMLFIRRAEREGDPWSGHVALPGGRYSPGDRDLLHTAARETWEEVGVPLDAIGRPIGRLADLWSPVRLGRPRLRVSAYVFAVPEELVLKPNHEVAGTMWVSLDRLIAGEGRGSRPWQHQGQPIELPTVHLDGHEIWGITLRFVDDLLERLGAADQGLGA